MVQWIVSVVAGALGGNRETPLSLLTAEEATSKQNNTPRGYKSQAFTKFLTAQ